MESLRVIVIALFLCAGTAADRSNSGIACERSVLSLRCPGGLVIRIGSAMYGRTTRAYCNKGRILSTACGHSVDQIVKNICDDSRSCRVDASNSQFTDTCPGTHKYLKVGFNCVRPAETVVTACEGGSVTLNCPVNTKIAISAANYGRVGRYTCNRDPIKTLRCSATNSKSVTNVRCRGRRTCTVAANNGVFGDPCRGTHKFLKVKYQCERY